MYGYRKSLENGLMTNLNSISSSLSSIETIGRRNNTLGKSSVDDLIDQSRTQSIASTSALYRGSKDDRRHPTMTSARNGGPRHQASDIYYNQGKRQVFDFLGQIWLQILINFFTILIIIVALFGLRQSRLSYLLIFIFWALFNTIWNLVVISIHSKMREVSLTEDFLSLYTGAISWWHSNGPGCLPYTITAPIQHQSVSILKPNIITGCRIDYHLLESTQAALHSSLSLISMLVCCFIACSLGRNCHKRTSALTYGGKHPNGADKPYRLNDLTNGRTSAKINHDPYPSAIATTSTSRLVSDGTSSLRRSAANKRASSRSSQHSLASARSERRRQRQASETAGSAALPTPRGSTSSAQRSQKYGSLSSRRSRSHRRAGEASSLTYASTSAGQPKPGTSSGRPTTNGQRTRLSSLSSADYLPSYQPPHSSSANLLSSYGEISSIDSYNNNKNNININNNRASNKRARHKTNERNGISSLNGNTNPTYAGSRSSVNSQNVNNMHNYDDISAVYGGTTNGSTYGTSSAGNSNERRRHFPDEDRSAQSRNRAHQHTANGPRDIRAEIYKMNGPSFNPNGHTQQQASRTNGFASNGGTFHSFTAQSQQSLTRPKTAKGFPVEVNNNHMTSNYMDTTNLNGQTNGTYDTNQGPIDDWSRSPMTATGQQSYIG